MYVLTQQKNFYKVNCEKRTFEKIDGFQRGQDVEMAEEGSYMEGSERETVEDFACGTDFITAKSSAGALFSMGMNKFGQLGLGFEKAET